MNTNHLVSICCLILLATVLTAGCNSSDSSPAATEVLPASIDMNGTWQISETPISSNCAVPPDPLQYQLAAVQNGSSLTVTDQYGNVFTGTVSANKISWTGSYPDEGGTTAITGMDVTVSADSATLNGTASWLWSDSTSSCSGSTAITGAKIN